MLQSNAGKKNGDRDVGGTSLLPKAASAWLPRGITFAIFTTNKSNGMIRPLSRHCGAIMLETLIFGLAVMAVVFLFVLFWISFVWKGPRIEEDTAMSKMRLSPNAEQPKPLR
jgi:hypothetical protein